MVMQVTVTLSVAEGICAALDGAPQDLELPPGGAIAVPLTLVALRPGDVPITITARGPWGLSDRVTHILHVEVRIGGVAPLVIWIPSWSPASPPVSPGHWGSFGAGGHQVLGDPGYWGPLGAWIHRVLGGLGLWGPLRLRDTRSLVALGTGVPVVLGDIGSLVTLDTGVPLVPGDTGSLLMPVLVARG